MTDAPGATGFRLGRCPALDGLRGAAVLAVMAFHAQLTVATGGYLGVDAFFVLSGFLITALLVEEWQERHTIALGAFWARRVLRLVPALVVVIIAVCIYAAFFAPNSWVPEIWNESVSAALYVSNWFQASTAREFSFHMSHAWSLSIEEQFYIVWPPVLLLLLWLRVPVRALAVLTALAALLSVLEMAWLFDGGARLDRVYYGTDTRAQALLVGVALALGASSGGFGVLRRHALVVSRVALVGAVALLALWVGADREAASMYRGGFALAAVLGALVIADVVVSPTSVLGALLAARWLRAVGRISYGLYLWHWPIFLVCTEDRLGLPFWPTLVVRFALTFGFALASWTLVERPILRYKHRFERASSSTAPVSVPVTGAPVDEGVTSTSGGSADGDADGGQIVVNPRATPRL